MKVDSQEEEMIILDNEEGSKELRREPFSRQNENSYITNLGE